MLDSIRIISLRLASSKILAGFEFCWIRHLLDSSFAGFNILVDSILLDSSFAGFKFCWIQEFAGFDFAGFKILSFAGINFCLFCS